MQNLRVIKENHWQVRAVLVAGGGGLELLALFGGGGAQPFHHVVCV